MQIRTPKKIEVKVLMEFGRKSYFYLFPNNLIFGLSQIVEGTFLKIQTFCQKNHFLKFRSDFPLLRSKSMYFELILRVSDCILGVWTYISGVWTYTLGVWTHVACFGCLNSYFGHQRTKHSGMTSESGNTEGPSILVWLVNLRILKKQAFWYGT